MQLQQKKTENLLAACDQLRIRIGQFPHMSTERDTYTEWLQQAHTAKLQPNP